MLAFGGVNQSGNQLGTGDIIAGNKEEKTVNNFFSADRQTHLSRLTDELQRQIKDGEVIDGLVEDYLQHVSTKPATEVIGLEEKLRLANWESITEQGIYFKELYHKKLLRTVNYRAAQEIHCLLLRKTAAVFLKFIKPILGNEGVTVENLNEIIDSKLVNPILQDLGLNIMSLYEDEISGMLYFLTGNCHLNWRKDVSV